jgi:hypothetical protein
MGTQVWYHVEPLRSHLQVFLATEDSSSHSTSWEAMGFNICEDHLAWPLVVGLMYAGCLKEMGGFIV